MNREIKFRGKQIDNSKWVHGDLRQVEGRCFIMDYDIGDDGITDHQRVFNIHYEVDPETVGQYTGLKDINQKDIYEGDIVQIQGHPFEGPMQINGNYEVGYNDRMELCCGSLLLHRERHYATVIGNKFENPSLLEVTNE
ncbi:hypothetical protein BK138_16210 [Paenibacillus rhizosphaerae]|uniref:YopX protein domain-containing protein n=1 Tax=Paenibacillus rhizosphaerae TaxID=297318 RepID=A0A1R1ESG9_9BACL|nr:YopX family protein [Paenibacillus rhizosphaerae]OMF54699.1 hypothetical protein BK138_16210 [Paenibacillus rhizosphaerae]